MRLLDQTFNHGLINPFGVDIKGTRRSLGRGIFTSQAQGLGPEGGIIAPAFGRWGAVFQDNGKIRP